MSYDQDRTAAAAMIAEAGAPVTLTRRGAATYDTATATTTFADEGTAQTTGVILPMPRITNMGFANAPGSLVQAGDQMLMLSAEGIDDTAQPRANDTVTIAGTSYTLVSVSPLMPDGTVIFYECFMRGVPA